MVGSPLQSLLPLREVYGTETVGKGDVTLRYSGLVAGEMGWGDERQWRWDGVMRGSGDGMGGCLDVG